MVRVKIQLTRGIGYNIWFRSCCDVHIVCSTSYYSVFLSCSFLCVWSPQFNWTVKVLLYACLYLYTKYMVIEIHIYVLDDVNKSSLSFLTNLWCLLVQLTDFGLSKVGLINSTDDLSGPSVSSSGFLGDEIPGSTLKQSPREQRQKHAVVGTPDYLAPEILLGMGHGLKCLIFLCLCHSSLCLSLLLFVSRPSITLYNFIQVQLLIGGL